MKHLTDKMLQVVLAVLVECSWRMDEVDSKSKGAFERLFTSALLEMQSRNLPRVECDSNLVERLGNSHSARYAAEEEALTDLKSYDPSSFDDDELALMYAIGAEIADFSFLGRGIRTLNEAIWLESEKEMERRDLERNFLCDLETE